MSDQPCYYAIIPADVRYAKIPPNAKLLYWEITALTTKEGFCWATNQYFADLYGVNKSAISRWISILQENGFLYVEITTKEDGTPIRNIRIGIREKPNGGILKKKKGYTQKEEWGYTQKSEHNNTSINNTINNNISSSLRSEDILREKKKNEDSEENFLPIDGEEIETEVEIVSEEDFETEKEKQKSSGAPRKISTEWTITDLINISGRPKSTQEIINEKRANLISFFRKVVGVDKFKDFSEWAEARRMEKLIEKIGKDDFLRRMKEVLRDPFKAKNCNKLSYLRKEIESYIHTPIFKQKQDTPKHGGLFRKPWFDD